MDLKQLNYHYNKFKFGEDNFHYLMKKRVKDILMVSSFYDAYIFEQDGRLSEQIFGEYKHLNLTTIPRITSVPTKEEALKKVSIHKYDLVITMMRVGETIPYELSKSIKQLSPNTPVLLLLNNTGDINLIKKFPEKMVHIDNVFYWNGDSKLFLAMIKYVEDRWNCDYDTKVGLVRVILLVEDSINFYSSYLPLLYAEIMKQTQLLIDTEMNDMNKRLRMRARPKVILANNYEDAIEIYNKYQEFIVCLISDIDFPKANDEYLGAGIKLLKEVRSMNADLPILMQSANRDYKDNVLALNAAFIRKHDRNLIKELKHFIKTNLGYGDFVFKDEKGNQYGKATTLKEFENILTDIPDISLLFHSRRNHFSSWLIAHGEFLVAKKIRPIGTSEFSSITDLREFLLNTFKEVRSLRARGKIINFENAEFNLEDQIVKIAEGSLGGKGRGLAFMNSLLNSMEFDETYPEFNISIPATCIIGTNEFDSFIEINNITADVSELPDEEIEKYFLTCRLSEELEHRLYQIILELKNPLAVRSSSLLEDSQAQPFAGIYSTYMLPNNANKIHERYQDLSNAVKLVYSSIFVKKARDYIENVNYMIAEEKMAVIIQEVTGSKFGNYYFPNFSGVAQSFNFYPTSDLENSDGIATIAVGMGKSVVEGENTYRFCPKYPKKELVSGEYLVGNSQKDFYAIDLTDDSYDLLSGEDVCLKKISIRNADIKPALKDLVSYWDYNSKAFISGMFGEGMPVVTFENIVKYNRFPLADILNDILSIGEVAMGVPVEIEFAVNLQPNKQKIKQGTFYILQIRPLSINAEDVVIDSHEANPDQCLIFSNYSMGNGIVDDLDHIIYVKPDAFDNTETIEIMNDIDSINRKMLDTNVHYVLIGPGRWGSRDRFLGIPTAFSNISMSKLIVEVGLENFRVDPSQGTHFFHNILSMNIGYVSVPYGEDQNVVNWQMLDELEVVEETRYVKLVKTKKNMTIKMDGKRGLCYVKI